MHLRTTGLLRAFERRRVATVVACTLAGALAAARPILAQSVPPHPPRLPAKDLAALRRCLDTIPPSEMRRVVVYAAAEPADIRMSRALPSIDALMSAVAERIRSRFRAPGGMLPRGDSALSWMGIGTPLRVVARRNTPLHWTFDEAGATSDGAALLASALDETVRDGESLLWPPTLDADSLVFTLALYSPPVRRDSAVETLNVRAATPVFSLPVPWETHADAPPLKAMALRRGVLDAAGAGSVILEFVVDDSGHVEPETITDVWPPDVGGPAGRILDRARREARIRLTKTQFTPSVIGGCAAPQMLRVGIPFRIE